MFSVAQITEDMSWLGSVLAERFPTDKPALLCCALCPDWVGGLDVLRHPLLFISLAVLTSYSAAGHQSRPDRDLLR